MDLTRTQNHLISIGTRSLDNQLPVISWTQIGDEIDRLAQAEGITLELHDKLPIVREIARRFGV